MFGISGGELLVLIVAGLFILGPERLPSAAAWLAKGIRQVRDYANGARDQLRSELGPEFDELRKPLEDLRQLREFNPKRAITRHLLDDYPEDNGYKPNGFASAPAPAAEPRPEQRPLSPGERPPFDPDAT
ncbi:sec-independent translocase [Kutzneria sp. CA-103260]|uniref:sec-independent translocase n=1 Tax=Kutzneria sp. CA-103260 TaxID=2802641 RepID=UPI001BA4BA17|nr:sec-independent translocase [Kutzneria sp. CA-103260]QUQ69065.1 sec-independent protein translocase protein TatB [Kutzneria sp. CA-103260]